MSLCSTAPADIAGKVFKKPAFCDDRVNQLHLGSCDVTHFFVIREFGVYTVSGTWTIQVVEGEGDMLLRAFINQREPMILQRS